MSLLARPPEEKGPKRTNVRDWAACGFALGLTRDYYESSLKNWDHIPFWDRVANMTFDTMLEGIALASALAAVAALRNYFRKV